MASTPETQAEFSARMAQGYADRDARWAASRHRELTTDMLMLRDSNLRDHANELDEQYDGDEAAKTVGALDAEWGEPDEDAADSDPGRYERYLTAMSDALLDVAEGYREQGPCMSWGSSGWDSEAFPKAALGL